MKTTGPIIILTLLAALLSGCTDDEAAQTPPANTSLALQPEVSVVPSLTPSPSVTESPISTPSPAQKEEKLSKYVNARYGFSIKVPSDWSTGEESDNGDGKILYVGNPDVDIRTYAAIYDESFSDPYHTKDGQNVQLQKIKLDNGYEATLMVGRQGNNILYEMVYISKDNVEYHFYALVSKDFFEKNEKTLLSVAKSMDMPE